MIDINQLFVVNRYPCDSFEDDGIIQLHMKQLVARWKLTTAAIAVIPKTDSDSEPPHPRLRKDWRNMLLDKALAQNIFQKNGKRSEFPICVRNKRLAIFRRSARGHLSEHVRRELAARQTGRRKRQSRRKGGHCWGHPIGFPRLFQGPVMASHSHGAMNDAPLEAKSNVRKIN